MLETSDAPIPKRARELFDKGLMAMERNNLPYAIEMFAGAVEIEPRFAKARKQLFAASVRVAQLEAPKNHVLTLLTSLPVYLKGMMAWKSGKFPSAMKIGQDLLLKDPLSPFFLKLYGQAAESAKLYDAVIEALESTRESFGKNIDLIFWLGRLYMTVDKPQEAKKCFEIVARVKPNDAAVLTCLKNAMAKESMTRGGWDKAQDGKSFRHAIKDVKASNVLEQESKAVKSEANIDMLIRETEEKIASDPENVNYRRSLANLYVQANRFADASRTLDELRKGLASGDPQIDQLVSSIRIKQFDYDIQQAKQKNDEAGAARLVEERCQFIFKDVQSRVERYPNDLPLRYDYGVLLYENNMINEAIQQFQLAQRNPQNRLKSLFSMAACFKTKGQFDMAREQFEKAAGEVSEMNDFKKEIYYQLGEVTEKLGDLQAAANYYKDIYQVDIGYKDVAAKIEKVYPKTGAAK